MEKRTKIEDKCTHEWEEDEMFASGAITMITGTLDDLGKETRVICKKCGDTDFVPKDIFNRLNLLKEND